MGSTVLRGLALSTQMEKQFKEKPGSKIFWDANHGKISTMHYIN